MENYSAVIRNTFEMGSIRDAELFFSICIKNAFPTSSYRGLEVVRFLRETQYLEGKSWNHVFEIRPETLSGHPVWEVSCHRVTMGHTPDKHVYLDYESLGFVQYKE